MNRMRTLMVLLACCLSFFSRSVLADPPGRVGRISMLSGQVDFRADPYDLVNPALMNWPITVDNILNTPRFGRAEVRIGSTALRMDDETELRFEQLDDQFVRLRMDKGHLFVRIRNVDNASQFELSTPQGRITVFGPAAFRVDFSVRPDSTTISLFSGRGQFDNKGVIWPLEQGKQFNLTYDETVTQNLVRSDFDNWCLNRDRADEQLASSRYVSLETTGYEELDRHGVWRDSSEYGPLWYPNHVADDWAPYRQGRWTWVNPWGWTWVDDAPWGYAPSHYGRWVWWKGRWCWTPGRNTARPVWTPAVVGWVVHQRSGNTYVNGNPNIGWYPLAPGTVYEPVYKVSQGYLDRINGGHSHRHNWPDGGYNAQTALTTMDSGRFTNNKVVIVKQGVLTMVDAKSSPNQLRQYDANNLTRHTAPPAPNGALTPTRIPVQVGRPRPNDAANVGPDAGQGHRPNQQPLPGQNQQPLPVQNQQPVQAQNQQPVQPPATLPPPVPAQPARTGLVSQVINQVVPTQVVPVQGVQPTHQPRPPVQQPVVQQPPAPQPRPQVQQPPVVQQPVQQQPLTPQPRPPVQQPPVVQQPVVQQPVAPQPRPQVQQPPVVQQPVVQQPVAPQPRPQVQPQPVVQQPVAPQPRPQVQQPPVVQQPVAPQPRPQVQQPPAQPPAPAQPHQPKAPDAKPGSASAKGEASNPRQPGEGNVRHRPENER